MKKLTAILFAILLAMPAGWAQSSQPRSPHPSQPQDVYAQEPQDVPDTDEPGEAPDLFSIPAGTHVPMTVVRAPEEGQAHEGARVYLRTRMPLRADGGVILPARSLVVGVLTTSAGSGLNQGNAGLVLRLRSITLPNNSRVALSGRVVGSIGTPGAAKPSATPAPGTSGLGALAGLTPEQLAAVSMFALAGGELGYAIGKNQKGTMIGSLIGAGVGMAAMMASNGSHLHLRPGTNVDAVLDEPLAIDPHTFN